MGVCGFGVALGDLPFGVWDCVLFFWRIHVLSLHWNLLAVGWILVLVQAWRLLGELLSINVPWSQEFSDVLKFWN